MYAIASECLIMHMNLRCHTISCIAVQHKVQHDAIAWPILLRLCSGFHS